MALGSLVPSWSDLSDPVCQEDEDPRWDPTFPTRRWKDIKSRPSSHPWSSPTHAVPTLRFH